MSMEDILAISEKQREREQEVCDKLGVDLIQLDDPEYYMVTTKDLRWQARCEDVHELVMALAGVTGIAPPRHLPPVPVPDDVRGEKVIVAVIPPGAISGHDILLAIHGQETITQTEDDA